MPQQLLSQTTDKHYKTFPLSDTKQFQHWALEQHRLGKTQEGIEQLIQRGCELSIYRAACLGHWFLRPNTFRSLMQKSAGARNLAISLAAQSTLALVDFVESHHKLAYCIPLLEEANRKLEQMECSELVVEAKVTVQTNLGLIKSIVGQTTQSLALAAQSVFMARQAGMPIGEMRATNLLIQSNLLSGQVSDGLSLIRNSITAGTTDQHAATYQHVSLAGCLAHLGNINGAIEWLEVQGHESVNPYAAPAVRQWFSCFCGYDNPSEPIEDRYTAVNSVRWLVESLRGLLATKTLPRTSKNINRRMQCLDSAIASARTTTQFASDWYFLLNRWISATAMLWQGKATLSAHSLTGLKVPAKEWLELRLLLAGLRLEQALDLNLPNLAIEPAEQELLEVFQDSESIPMASSEGLADLLIFWYPLAAAYMAVAFPNLPHLSPALDNILRLGSKNSALGKTVSPALAGELLLRSLNLDLNKSQPLTQVKLGAGERGNFREDILTFTRGPRTYYQPPISALQIAYGLRKHGAGTLMAEVAWSILNQYGLCPKASGSEMQLRMSTLEALTHDLLNDRITVQEFSRGCYGLV